MKSHIRLAFLSFLIPALLSTWGAMVLINAIFVSLNPVTNYAGPLTFPTLVMVFFGLLAIVAPMIIMLGGKQDS